MSIGGQRARKEAKHTEVSYDEVLKDSIIFSAYPRTSFRRPGAPEVLYLATSWLDRVSSLPIDMQPYVAEYLKRSILPVPAW